MKVVIMHTRTFSSEFPLPYPSIKFFTLNNLEYIYGSSYRNIAIYGSSYRDIAIYGSSYRDIAIYGSSYRDIAIYGSSYGDIAS